jgi:hypothetical protein
MQWSREAGWLDHRRPASGLKKSHALKPANLIFGPDPFVELKQVGAAAQQNVLAVVYHFSGAGVLVG